MTEAEKAYQYFVIAVPENEEQAKAYFWARKALQPTLTPPNEPLSPYPDGDTSILACPCCGSGEYLHNEDGNEQNYCGQCGQAIDWSRPPEGET